LIRGRDGSPPITQSTAVIDMAVIMIVDDVPDMVDLITDMLEPLGHEFIPAYSGEGALEKLESVTPDLILLDIMMPGMDGIEVCKRVKENPATSGIPVVMVTGKHDMESHLDAAFVEADGYIIKPFTMDMLIQKVKDSLEEAKHHGSGDSGPR